ncbi:putative amidoligase enzyme-domain-containing protein [Hypoxylon cercidicola]|nr:putative amidoligase enzyme-domain-containing protein [Hypoxylon cercidicola]
MSIYYYFGVEIELIAEPHKVRNPLLRWVYYEKLATALRNQGLDSLADKLDQKYRKHGEHYDKWWITKDGSLGDPPHPQIPLEAVSPILRTESDWAEEIDLFWTAWQRVFHMPIRSKRCGAHIHISPCPDKEFTMEQLRNIAFGVVFYEPLVEELLPKNRRNNQYCVLNTRHSSKLLLHYYDESDLFTVWELIQDIEYRDDLRDFMQEKAGDRNDRYVLWNFSNIWAGSGTVEFRGGRGLRGPVRTKRWISFVISFIDMCIDQGFGGFRRPTIEQFWGEILSSAEINGVRHMLPSNWKAMAELESADTYEEMGDYLDSSDESDVDSILSKADSVYSDSNYTGDEKEEMIQELEAERASACVIL